MMISVDTPNALNFRAFSSFSSLYNYPQGRVTDHRIGLTLHKLDAIVNGDLSELLDALVTASQAEKLQQVK